jgi:hypothetical protein
MTSAVAFLLGSAELDQRFAAEYLHAGERLAYMRGLTHWHWENIKADAFEVCMFDIGPRRMPASIVGFVADPPPPKPPRKRKRDADDAIDAELPPKKRYKKPLPTGFVRVKSARMYDFAGDRVGIAHDIGKALRGRPYHGSMTKEALSAESVVNIHQRLGREIAKWEALRSPAIPCHTESQRDQLELGRIPQNYSLSKVVFGAMSATDQARGYMSPYREMAHFLVKDGVMRGTPYEVHKGDAIISMRETCKQNKDLDGLAMLRQAERWKYKLDDLADGFCGALHRAKLGDGRCPDPF